MRYVFFTDLDGSLLDHGDYSFRAAEPALRRLRSAATPLILVTSKTRAEVEIIRDQLGNPETFIVENGAAIFFPPGALGADCSVVAERRYGYDMVKLGVDYGQVRDFLLGPGSRFGVRGFGDMTDEDVAAETGLQLEAARLARRREFSEPFLLDEPAELQPLAELARRHDLTITRGGRFEHLFGAGQDKGRAVRIVIEVLSAHVGQSLTSVGLGDSPNDLPMLEAVDIPIVIPHADGPRVRVEREDAIVAPCPGSRGWNQAVLELLSGCD